MFVLSCLAFGFNNCYKDKLDKVESQTSSSKMTHTNPSPIQSSTPTINPSPNPEANQSLIEAVWEGNISKVRDALNNGANINFRCNDGYASTALMVAVRMGDIEIVELLLEAGANVNAQDINGKTALMWTSSIAFTYYLTYWPAITKMNLCTGLPCNDTQGPIRENEQNGGTS